MKWGGPYDPELEAIWVPALASCSEEESSYLAMILDTGTPITVFHTPIAEFLGLDKSQSVGKVRFRGLVESLEGYQVIVPRFEVYGRVRENFKVAVCQLDPELGIDGLIGKDFTRGLRTLLDDLDGRIIMTDERISIP
ncbi:hypothetical protein COW64_07225 [bacterium (Candidatus Blackallbacteria) CG18_big_fil_WC_8_21_14_2_50_49_26]|nr:MAG: hypothetical protein COW64_07225 [bacterium (Candidatus Blackallbacteria) CG18_big_fil_WC_8_21_14_2_50_49_26]